MDTPTLNPLVASSTDPTQISNYVKGIIIGLSSIIIYGASALLHITLQPQDVISLGTDVGMIAGSIWFVYGLLHKGVATLGRAR